VLVADQRSLIEIAETVGPVAAFRAAAMNFDAALTRTVGADPRALAVIPGRLIQAVRNRSFLRQFATEHEALVHQGKIRPDYEKSEQGLSCLQELLAALESPPVGQRRFDVLKRIYLVAATETLTSRDDTTPQLLMGIAKELGPGEVLVLAAVHRKSQDPEAVARVRANAHLWLREIARDAAINREALVEYHEIRIMQMKLISGRTLADQSGISPGEHLRLTDLGVRFGEFLSADPGGETKPQ
jgi:hypothetical protein